MLGVVGAGHLARQAQVVMGVAQMVHQLLQLQMQQQTQVVVVREVGDHLQTFQMVDQV
jgi:hypothetical protein